MHNPVLNLADILIQRLNNNRIRYGPTTVVGILVLNPKCFVLSIHSTLVRLSTY